MHLCWQEIVLLAAGWAVLQPIVGVVVGVWRGGRNGE